MHCARHERRMQTVAAASPRAFLALWKQPWSGFRRPLVVGFLSDFPMGWLRPDWNQCASQGAGGSTDTDHTSRDGIALEVCARLRKRGRLPDGDDSTND